MSTLRFAVQAKALRTCARVNCEVDPKDAAITRLQRQLQLRVEAERRWKLKFHRLSSQVQHTAEEDSEDEEEEERNGALSCELPSSSSAERLPSPPLSPPPLSAISEADGAEDEEMREAWEQRESRICTRLLDLHCQLQNLQPSHASAPRVQSSIGDGPRPSLRGGVKASVHLEQLLDDLRSALLLPPATLRSPHPAHLRFAHTLRHPLLSSPHSSTLHSTASWAEDRKGQLVAALQSTRQLREATAAVKRQAEEMRAHVASALQQLSSSSVQLLHAAEERCAAVSVQLSAAREDAAQVLHLPIRATHCRLSTTPSSSEPPLTCALSLPLLTGGLHSWKRWPSPVSGAVRMRMVG